MEEGINLEEVERKGKGELRRGKGTRGKNEGKRRKLVERQRLVVSRKKEKGKGKLELVSREMI